MRANSAGLTAILGLGCLGSACAAWGPTAADDPSPSSGKATTLASSTPEAPSAPSTPEAGDPPVEAAVDELVVGPFRIVPGYHATARIEVDGSTFWLDPWSKADLSHGPADVILITDVHPDHYDVQAIAQVEGETTVMVAPEAVATLRKDAGKAVAHVLANGSTAEVAGVSVTAMPMYNQTRGPEPGKLYHDKGRGNGYLLERDGTRVYFAGDTACTEEMEALKDVDVAFVPMNLPYTMPPDEAAACVVAFGPAMVVPYHHAGSDLEVFAAGLAAADRVTLRRLEFYPGGQPW